MLFRSAIMAQLVHMDARLDTFNDELCQVKTCVGRIAQRQAEMGGYTMPSTPVAPTEESDVDDDDDDDNDANSDDEDEGDASSLGDASSPSDDEMST